MDGKDSTAVDRSKTTSDNLTGVLCVDDEPLVLEGLSRHLRRKYRVKTATSGKEGLDILQREGPFAIVVSDMRMPEMDGAEFLKRAKNTTPDATRVLLTGQADMDDAISAVNDGNIFRFLRKPCAPGLLLATLQAAEEQHRLVTAEKILLEQTLHGSIMALTEVLSLASPAAFGKSNRAKQLVSDLMVHMSIPDRWQIEVAAMLSQIGCITLPPSVADRVYRGEALKASEERMVSRLPEIAANIMTNIPRLENIQDILLYQNKRYDGKGLPRDGVLGEEIPFGARALKIVLDFDYLESSGNSRSIAMDTMRSRHKHYDPSIFSAFEEMLGDVSTGGDVRVIAVSEIEDGMVFVEDVMTESGMLLVSRGQEVTPSLYARITNFAKNVGVKEPLKITIPESDPEPPQEAGHSEARTIET